MTEAATAKEPTGPRAMTSEPDGAPRIATLDILRGIAILGILFMNINDMGASFSYPDIRHLGWSGADQVAWWLRQILADGTARGMLELLFGAGMVILTERIAAGSGRWSTLRRYYWRNIVLVAFGLVHMFVLLWPGDILHTYGVAALVVFLFRNLRPRWLIAIGLIGATFQAGFVGYNVYSSYQQRAETSAAIARRDAHLPLTAVERKAIEIRQQRHAKFDKEQAETARTVAKEDRERPASAGNWIAAAWSKSVERLLGGEIFSIWEAAGTMLIGAALFKLNILQGRRSRAFYLRMTLVGYGLGGGWRTIGAYQDTRFAFNLEWHWVLDEFARIGMTLGHLGLVCLLLTTVAGGRWLAPFAAAGRTALTIYVLQTVICVGLLFPPWGLNLYAKLSWMPLMLTSIAVDGLLLIAAVAWVGRFRIAPVEWAWRSLIERRVLAFK